MALGKRSTKEEEGGAGDDFDGGDGAAWGDVENLQ